MPQQPELDKPIVVPEETGTKTWGTYDPSAGSGGGGGGSDDIVSLRLGGAPPDDPPEDSGGGGGGGGGGGPGGSADGPCCDQAKEDFQRIMVMTKIDDMIAEFPNNDADVIHQIIVDTMMDEFLQAAAATTKQIDCNELLATLHSVDQGFTPPEMEGFKKYIPELIQIYRDWEDCEGGVSMRPPSDDDDDWFTASSDEPIDFAWRLLKSYIRKKDEDEEKERWTDEEVGESYDDAWMGEEDIDPKHRTTSKRRKKRKNPIFVDPNIEGRGIGGQRIPEIEREDEEGNPIDLPGTGLAGGSGGKATRRRDREGKQRKEAKIAARERRAKLKALREKAEEMMSRRKEHPGSLLDVEDMIDLEHDTYQPPQNLGRLDPYSRFAGGRRPVDMKDPKTKEKLLSGDFTISDMAAITDPWYLEGMAGDNWEERSSNPPYPLTGHVDYSDKQFRSGVSEALERGTLPAEDIEMTYHFDPETGEPINPTGEPSADIKIRGLALDELESKHKDAIPVKQRTWLNFPYQGATKMSDYLSDTEKITHRPSFAGLPWNEETGFTRGEPIDIAFTMLKM